MISSYNLGELDRPVLTDTGMYYCVLEGKGTSDLVVAFFTNQTLKQFKKYLDNTNNHNAVGSKTLESNLCVSCHQYAQMCAPRLWSSVLPSVF